MSVHRIVKVQPEPITESATPQAPRGHQYIARVVRVFPPGQKPYDHTEVSLVECDPDCAVELPDGTLIPPESAAGKRWRADRVRGAMEVEE